MLIPVIIVIAAVGFLRSDKSGGFAGESTQENVKDESSKTAPGMQEKEDTPREKLKEGICVRTDQMIQDNLNWITDTETIRQAMEEFYEMTGVQPYLYICDSLGNKGAEITDEEAESYLKTLYETLYDDEGHMIFVFMEYAESEYITFLYTGEAADDVLDEEAREIFLTNADRYYTDSSLSDEEYFAKIFRESAKQIM